MPFCHYVIRYIINDMELFTIDHFLQLLGEGEAFALTRFNDGEARGIFRVGDTVARGMQKVPPDLSAALRAAAEHVQDNYYVGIPCEKCYPKWNAKMLDIISTDLVTYATVTTNENLKKVYKQFPKLLRHRFLTWVGAYQHDLEALEMSANILTSYYIPVRNKNAWGDYGRIVDLHDRFPERSVVLLSCGPLAEVLIHQWFMKRPDLTLIDVGSTFDPYTKNVWNRCHKGTLKYCSICNRVKS